MPAPGAALRSPLNSVAVASSLAVLNNVRYTTRASRPGLVSVTRGAVGGYCSTVTERQFETVDGRAVQSTIDMRIVRERVYVRARPASALRMLGFTAAQARGYGTSWLRTTRSSPLGHYVAAELTTNALTALVPDEHLSAFPVTFDGQPAVAVTGRGSGSGPAFVRALTLTADLTDDRKPQFLGLRAERPGRSLLTTFSDWGTAVGASPPAGARPLPPGVR